MEPIYILGRYNAAELVYTSLDVITVTLSGFRVVGNGPYEIGNVPQLQDLMNNNDFSLSVVDRQTGETITVVTGCRVASWSSGTASRSVSDLTVTVNGTVLSDESGAQSEAGAVDFG